QE
ncbi:hypothetical protein D043_2202B, partial [Vibrio parahaemolyticus EKP-021]